jgi:hypothetical protein
VDPNPDPGGQKYPQKKKKVKKFHVLRAGCFLFRAESFFPVAWTSFNRGLEISKLQFLIEEISKTFFSCKFF